MSLTPFERMELRVRAAFDDSDAEGFEAVMLYGELLLKLSVSGLASCLKEDKDQTRYALSHGLVRSNGLGDWAAALHELTTGPARQVLEDDAREFANSLTRKASPGTWQSDFGERVKHALELALGQPQEPQTGAKASWGQFVTLRNRTRGHGALTGGLKAELAPIVKAAVEAYAAGFGLFAVPWAYVKRNLSGKYRVTSLSRVVLPESLTGLRTDAEASFEDGVYVHVGEARHVDLLTSDPDVTDFFVPNGRYTNRGYEMLSYITGKTTMGDATRYQNPPGSRPRSETSGAGQLDSNLPHMAVHNLPKLHGDYVDREGLESELLSALESPYPLVSLVGRGGIGKTSVALKVLHSSAVASRFDVIVWFSARDIDLMAHGPALVRPDVLDFADMANEFAKLMSPFSGPVDATSYLEQALHTSPTGGPMLFVLDNFETVSNPRDLFLKLANLIRPPNRVLITSRIRDFDRDYRIPVHGMTADEAERLIHTSARKRGIEGSINAQFVQSLHDTAGGHPYIIKVLLGEAARTGDFRPVKAVLAPKDDLLAALFERTYSSLSPLARRVFLTLCSWTSPQAETCLEAVVARSTGQADVADAVEELDRASLLDVKHADEDNSRFFVVPLAGHLFGEAKLQASSEKLAVLADREVLMMFGSVLDAEIHKGTAQRAEHFLRVVSRRSENRDASLTDHVEVLEYVARRSPGVWWLLSIAFEESLRERNLELAVKYMRRYIESGPSNARARSAWERVAHLSLVLNDPVSELHAIAEYCAVAGTWKEKISEGLYRVAQILADSRDSFERPERMVLVHKLIDSFTPHVEDATATELSRLAWLHIQIHERGEAVRVVRLGLQRDSDNHHCRNLAERLGM